ncbi:hypothetical protein O6H91_Y321300 [Diphasiastrum complanatum]|nr:hypothetical protein O6H91_Y321300 [Diphasiastrum complanatum]
MSIRYRRGKFNTVADALSRMPIINELSFTQIRNELLESLRGKCQHDAFFSIIWNSVQNRQLQTPEPVPGAGANSSKNTAASVEDDDESEYTSSDDVEDSEPVLPKQTPVVEGQLTQGFKWK